MHEWILTSYPVGWCPGQSELTSTGVKSLLSGRRKQRTSFYGHDPDTAPPSHSHRTGQNLFGGLYLSFLQKPMKDGPLQQLQAPIPGPSGKGLTRLYSSKRAHIISNTSSRRWVRSNLQEEGQQLPLQRCPSRCSQHLCLCPLPKLSHLATAGCRRGWEM